MPEYEKFGRAAPLKRNITIIENADLVLAFWDGKSKGTKFVIDSCKKSVTHHSEINSLINKHSDIELNNIAVFSLVY